MRAKPLAAVATTVLVGSFFAALWVIDRLWDDTGAVESTQIAPPPSPATLGYNTTRFSSIKVNSTARFSDGQNAGALLSGWSSPESWGVWSDGSTAELGIVPQGIGQKGLVLQITCNVFITPEIKKQKVEVWSGALKLHEAELGQTGSISVPIPARRLQDGLPAVMTFKIPTATAPKDQPNSKSSDSRKLGIGLTSIRLVEK